MNNYKIGVYIELGGYVIVKANTPKEATIQAREKLEANGIEGFEDVSITHREVDIINNATKV